MRHVTEADLRRDIGLREGVEVRLAPDQRLTPAARDFVQERRLQVVTTTPVQDRQGNEQGALHPLCLNTDAARSAKPLFDAEHPKLEHQTHLNAHEAVSKSHPRILLRGKLDSLIAEFVMAQIDVGREGELQGQIGDVVQRCLADLRSWAGWILRAEVTGEILAPLKMATLSYDDIRKFSHHPLRHLHQNHVLPERSHGPDVARLNRLRALVREVELCAVHTFTNEQNEVERSDVIMALNRLSSAVYILMILVVAQRAGVTTALKEFV